MITRREMLGLLATLPLTRGASAMDDLEPSYLRPLIEQGKLPHLAARLPKAPRVVNVAGMGRQAGRHGGIVRMLIGAPKDIRQMTINGYTRLVGYTEKLELQADVLESFDVQDERIFTFKLREGHKWSDGSDLTPEDFRFVFEDVFQNEDIAPGGFASALLVNGKPPVFEIVDPLTVRYTWEAPNPDFLPQLAAAQPLYMVMPSAYLKQFHKKFQDKDKLEELMKTYKAKKWARLFNNMSKAYQQQNPDLPMLDPWVNTSDASSEIFIFVRNPYFHRIDETGRQLPYIDSFELGVSSSSIIPAKTGAGESDLQYNNIDFSDYTFLKEAEKLHPIKVSLWKRTQGSRIVLIPNLNFLDETWRNFMQDVRVRRALSLAIDRREINMAVFFGLAKPSADTMLEESPLYKPEYALAWTAHQPDLANEMLDEAGYDKRDDDGMRLLPDGRPIKIVVETSGESTLETDVLELVTDHWSKIGIGLFVRTSQRDIFRSRVIGGEVMMATWSGLDNGLATADMNPRQMAPTVSDQLQWPIWGMHYESHGEKGEAPQLPEAAELLRLLGEWRHSATKEERADVWHKMLRLYTDQVFSIGIVNATLQPVVRSALLRNVPEQGLYSFDPTCYFGVYMPDTFWFGDGAQA